MKLNLGCGPNVFAGWLNIDKEDMTSYLTFLANPATDMGPMPPEQRRLAEQVRQGGLLAYPRQVADIRKGLLFPSGSVDLIYLGQVIEHLNPVYEAPQLCKECWRVLKPGGIMRVSTPNLHGLVSTYVVGGDLSEFSHEQPAYYAKGSPARRLAYIMYGSGGPASNSEHYEGHQMLYSDGSLRELLEEAGFSPEKIAGCPPHVSQSDAIQAECVDTGVSHSIFLEAMK